MKKKVYCDCYDAIEKCIREAENDSGWTGWRIPLFASYEDGDEEISFSVGSALSNNSDVMGAFECFSCNYWHRTWDSGDAEAWAKECMGVTPDDFDEETEFNNEVDMMVSNFFGSDDFEIFKEAIRENFPNIDIEFVE